MLCALGSRHINQLPFHLKNQKYQLTKLQTAIGSKYQWTFIAIATLIGATSFCLEILWSRSFALVIGSSIYSFNLMLVSFLVGLVFGTWIYEKSMAMS